MITFGYSTLQDVESGDFYDWEQHLAEDGYLLLAGRVRKAEERKVSFAYFNI